MIKKYSGKSGKQIGAPNAPQKNSRKKEEVLVPSNAPDMTTFCFKYMIEKIF